MCVGGERDEYNNMELAYCNILNLHIETKKCFPKSPWKRFIWKSPPYGGPETSTHADRSNTICPQLDDTCAAFRENDVKIEKEKTNTEMLQVAQTNCCFQGDTNK